MDKYVRLAPPKTFENKRGPWLKREPRATEPTTYYASYRLSTMFLRIFSMGVYKLYIYCCNKIYNMQYGNMRMSKTIKLIIQSAVIKCHHTLLQYSKSSQIRVNQGTNTAIMKYVRKENTKTSK